MLFYNETAADFTRLSLSLSLSLSLTTQDEDYPDDMTIQGIRDATKLPASKIVKWFKEKRDGARNQRHRDARNRQAEKEGFYGGRHREGRGGYGKQNRRKQRDVVEDWGDDYY